MAKKYESDIDPNEFIRSFREEPSGLSSLKRITAEPKGGNSQSTTEQVKAPAESPPAVTAVSDDSIKDYMKRFVNNSTYLRPQRRYLMVEIDPDFIRKIKRIISYECNSPCSIKSYVNKQCDGRPLRAIQSYNREKTITGLYIDCS